MYRHLKLEILFKFNTTKIKWFVQISFVTNNCRSFVEISRLKVQENLLTNERADRL